jgi:hypothetical protein
MALILRESPVNFVAMRLATVSEAPVAGPMLKERLTGLYKRKQVVEDLIRSLEQYGSLHGFRKHEGQAPMGAQGVYGLLR